LSIFLSFWVAELLTVEFEKAQTVPHPLEKSGLVTFLDRVLHSIKVSFHSLTKFAVVCSGLARRTLPVATHILQWPWNAVLISMKKVCHESGRPTKLFYR
jgi:hypothetical protein